MTALCELRGDRRLRLRSQDPGQRQAAQGQAADLEEIAPADAVTVVATCTAADVQHALSPSCSRRTGKPHRHQRRRGAIGTRMAITRITGNS